MNMIILLLYSLRCGRTGLKQYPLASFSLCFSSLFFFREPNEAYFETRSSATAIFEHGEKQLRKEAEKEGLEGVMVEGDLYFHL